MNMQNLSEKYKHEPTIKGKSKASNNIEATFEDEIHGQNIKKIFLIGIIYTLFEMVGLTLSTLGFFKSDIRMYVSVIVFIHIIYLSSLYIAKRKNRTGWLIEYMYYFIILNWASVFTTVVLLGAEDITVYGAIVMLIAAVMIIKPSVSRILYVSTFIVLAVLVYTNTADVLVANAIMFKALIITVLAVVISNGNYNSKKSVYDANLELKKVNIVLQNQNFRDSMTGLYNNAYIFNLLDSTIEKLKSSSAKLSVLMIDIDDFKMINDSYGHLVGDEVIKETSNKLKSLVRANDSIARYGGEEFLIILNDADIDLASEIAERIRQDIMNLNYGSVEVTVSIGVCEWENHITKDIIDAADKRLYKAKESGKNRVVSN